jgi:hypothetical protein
LRKGHGLGLLTVALVTAGPIVPGATSGAAAERNLLAAASASGARMSYTVPDAFLTSELVDAGGPVAEAVVDSTGRARSFASMPWPGANVVAFPGTLAVAIQQPVPVAYPFFVEASYPTIPSGELSDPSGAYALTATATARAAGAAGQVNDATAGSGSRAKVDSAVEPDGAVQVVAETLDTGLALGDGALRFGRIVSRSQTRLGPADEKTATTTSLLIEGASVAGQAVTVDADGVHAAGNSVPIGGGLNSVSSTLRQAGITVEILPGTTFPGGGTSDALVVTGRHPIPNNPDARVTWRLGGATSEIALNVQTPFDGGVAYRGGQSDQGDQSDRGGQSDRDDRGTGVSERAGGIAESPSTGRRSGTSGAAAEGSRRSAPDPGEAPGGSVTQAAQAPLGRDSDPVPPILAFGRLSGKAEIPLLVMTAGAVLLLLSTRRARKGA